MLPGIDGLSICKELRMGERTRDIPIIMITAKSEEADQIEGFAKRCGRLRHQALQQQNPAPAREGPSASRRRPRRPRRRRRTYGREDRPRPPSGDATGPKKLDLTPTEFRLLECMVRQPGRAFSRHQLMDSAIGEGQIVLERTIDVHIKTLRKKARRPLRPIGRRDRTHRNRPRRRLPLPRSETGIGVTRLRGRFTPPSRSSPSSAACPRRSRGAPRLRRRRVAAGYCRRWAGGSPARPAR